MTVQLFDQKEADHFPWEEMCIDSSRSHYLRALLKKGTRHFVDNIDTPLRAAKIGGLAFPFTICDDDCVSSYVASLYNQYIGYALDELNKHISPRMRLLTRSFLVVLGELLRAGQLNRCVHVNNWLFSTNLTPTMQVQELQKMTEALVDSYPKHAIVFRSVNAWRFETIHTFMQAGFSPLFSRQVFMLDTKEEAPFKERHFKKDVKLISQSGYELFHADQLSPSDAPRIAELYYDLNIHKYSRQNPQFNPAFTGMAINNGALRFSCLRRDGRIDAVYGCYDNGEMMVAPFFGYDTSLPEEAGLYRQISALAVLEAKEKGLILNQSSGASSFKLRRKAKPVLEYHMVYTKHLNPLRRAAWRVMRTYGNKVVLPFAVKNKI